MAEIVLFRPAENPNALLSTRCPLGLVYIGSYLTQRGYSVKIIDSGSCKDWLSELKKSIDSSTVCAGVSVMTGYQIKGALDFAKAVKQIRQIPVVWGGLHPSLLPDQTIKNDFVDVVVIDDGEKSFFHLVENIKNNRNLDTVSNIVFKQNGEVKYSHEDKEPMDLNTLPLPDYSLINFEYYSIFSDANGLYDKRRVIGLNTDRGCPYRCAYCYNLKFNKGRYRMICAERVLDLLSESKKRYNMDAVNFVSDNFFVEKNRVYNICKGIIDRKLNIAWHTDIRIDTFLEYDNEMIKVMKKSGCETLTFGVESGSERILSLMQKDITVDEVINAHKKAKDYGFRVNYHFMLGFPDETYADIKATLKLMLLLGKDKNVNFYGPSMYVPYPGTPLYDYCIKLGFIPPSQLEGWIQYDWVEYSKLPCFSKSFKNYMVEVQHIARHSHMVPNRVILYRIYYCFCRWRLIALMSGIRFYNVDLMMVNLFKKLWLKLNYAIGR